MKLFPSPCRLRETDDQTSGGCQEVKREPRCASFQSGSLNNQCQLRTQPPPSASPPPHKCQEPIINDRLVLNERFMLQKGRVAVSWHTEGFRASTVSAHQKRPGEMTACNGLAAKAMTAIGEADDYNKNKNSLSSAFVTRSRRRKACHVRAYSWQCGQPFNLWPPSGTLGRGGDIIQPNSPAKQFIPT